MKGNDPTRVRAMRAVASVNLNRKKDMPHTLEQKRLHSQKVRAERKQFAHTKLGGACVACGSHENLEMDHINPKYKKNNVSRMYTYSWAKFMAELNKCQLLCKSCHVVKTSSNDRKVMSSI